MSETRVGMGIDIHAYGPVKSHGHHIMLCGIPILHDKALEGHSDSDVVLHALVDALLGSIGAGDIGQHFPNTDEQWKDANSDIFLDHAHTLVKQKSGRIINIDLTIVAQTPKIDPHRNAMRERISELLNISVDRINIKATTTEKLGFLGRSEGIAAYAVVMVNIEGE